MPLKRHVLLYAGAVPTIKSGDYRRTTWPVAVNLGSFEDARDRPASAARHLAQEQCEDAQYERAPEHALALPGILCRRRLDFSWKQPITPRAIWASIAVALGLRYCQGCHGYQIQ